MKIRSTLLLLSYALCVFNCNIKKEEHAKNSEARDDIKKSSSVPPKAWIGKRVQMAKDRLAKSKEGQILWKAIEKYGGLENWYSNGPIYFRFNYKNLKSGGPDTYQTVDTWSAKARHQLVSDTTTAYGWDGEKAWKYPYNASVKENPRFWSLTPFYFVGMPFVIADEGIKLQDEGEITFEGNTYHQIRVNFADDLGDAPDDFYVLYIDTTTFRIGGLRYIVSYPGFYEKGTHGPEKHMTYYGKQTIDGIQLPQSIKTYAWDGQKPREHLVNITITDVDFRPETAAEFFDIPEGSRIMEGYAFD
jgi:hypothetical protein